MDRGLTLFSSSARHLELIAAAVAAGAEEVILGVGGSATTDGGQGAVEALNEAGVSPELVVLCDSNVAWEDCARAPAPGSALVHALSQAVLRLAGGGGSPRRGNRAATGMAECGRFSSSSAPAPARADPATVGPQ